MSPDALMYEATIEDAKVYKKRIRKPYPNRSAALTTAGGLLFSDVRFVPTILLPRSHQNSLYAALPATPPPPPAHPGGTAAFGPNAASAG
jgi:hypothetical protein